MRCCFVLLLAGILYLFYFQGWGFVLRVSGLRAGGLVGWLDVGLHTNTYQKFSGRLWYMLLELNIFCLCLDGQLIFMPSDILPIPGCADTWEVDNINTNSFQQQSALQMDKNYPVWGLNNAPKCNGFLTYFDRGIPAESDFWLKSWKYTVKRFITV